MVAIGSCSRSGAARRIGAILLALAASAAGTARADLHALWDDRCAGCHGHAGAFARKFLQVEDGRLRGTHHRDDLERFLRQHYLADADVPAVAAMLAAQAATPPLFAQRCGGCHGSAADFARRSLALRDGVLVGRASGRPVDQFLAAHGGVDAAERRQIVQSLTRVLAETGGPGR